MLKLDVLLIVYRWFLITVVIQLNIFPRNVGYSFVWIENWVIKALDNSPSLLATFWLWRRLSGSRLSVWRVWKSVLRQVERVMESARAVHLHTPVHTKSDYSAIDLSESIERSNKDTRSLFLLYIWVIFNNSYTIIERLT